MSDSGSAGAGWFHAQGDPHGTQRYWDGNAWVGGPQPVPMAPTPPPPPAPAVPPPPGPAAPNPAGTMPYGSAPGFEPPKKRSVWKWVVGVIAGFVLVVGGCSYLVLRAATGPINAGNDFLAELQAGDTAGAWALSDPACFEAEGIAALDVFAGARIEGYRLTTSNNQINNGNQRGTTSGTITFSGGDERDIELFLVNRDGWLVCGFDIGPADG